MPQDPDTELARTPEGYEDRPGRSGEEVGDATGGEGAEFSEDATTGETDPDDEVADADAGASYLAARGESPTDR